MILLGGLMCLTAKTVNAHAALLSAEPPPGAMVSAVSEIRLTFSELLATESAFILFADGFRQVRGIAPQVEGAVLRVALAEPLPPGDYTVQWKAVSSTEGHTGHSVEGSYQFRVGKAGVPASIGWALFSGAVIAAAAIGLVIARRTRQTRDAGG